MLARRANCGCKSGAAAAVVVLAGYIGYLSFAPQATPPSPESARLFTGLGLTLGGAVVGKLGGILYHAIRITR
jgi:hypothetical protein